MHPATDTWPAAGDPPDASVRAQLMHLARGHGHRHFDARAQRCLIARDTTWWAISLLHSDEERERALGNRLLEAVPCEDSTHTPATIAAILCAIPGHISSAAHAHLTAELRRMLPECARAVWHDGNVNHPVAAWCAALVGGGMFGDASSVVIARTRLEDFRRTIGDRTHAFHRQAAMPEYASPTYTALTLWWLAVAAEYARDAHARRTALFLEEQTWIETALHWHAPSQQIAGPSSRSYTDDSMGCWSALHCTLAIAAEQAAARISALAGRSASPTHLLACARACAAIHLDPSIALRCDHPSSIIENGLPAIIPFHIPDAALRLAIAKPLPMTLKRATYGEQYHENHATRGFNDAVYPGGWSELTTHMTRAHALGTASRTYINGAQTDVVSLRICRDARVRTRADVRSMFVRGVFGDARPCHANDVRVTGGRTDASFLYEEGRTAVLQHRGSAIVLYAPKAAGGGVVEGFRVDLHFTWDAPFDVCTVGGHPFTGEAIEAHVGARMLFRDARTAGAVIPLALDPVPATGAVRVHAEEGLLTVSLVNHAGPALPVDDTHLRTWRNGFVLIVEECGDDAAWQSFRERIAQVGVCDTVDAYGVRTVTAEIGRDVLALAWHPLSEEIIRYEAGGRDVRVRHFELESPVDARGEGHTDLLRAILPLYGHEAWSAFLARDADARKAEARDADARDADAAQDDSLRERHT